MRDLRGLEQLRLSSLLEETIASGGPVELPLDSIDFDPSQPRRYVDPEALQELAKTIREVGIVQPISVRPSPDKPGRYLVNVGERRARACRIAGRASIPAFVQEAVDPYARVIENLAREDLSPFDLAAFIAEREAAGERRNTIADRLGRSVTFLSEVMALANAPPEVQRLYESGRCRDVRTLTLIARQSRLDPSIVHVLTTGTQPITRKRVGAICGKGSAPSPLSARSQAERSVRRGNGLLVDCEGRAGFLRIGVVSSSTEADVVFNDGSQETVELRRLRLIQWTTL